MLGMIKKDLYMVKNNVRSLTVFILVYIIYSFVFELNMAFIFPFIVVIMFVSTFNYDDYNNWHLYVTSLPNGRVNAVKSKYITALILTVVAMVVSCLFGFFVSMYKENYMLLDFAATSIGAFFALSIMISLIFPFLFKYGAEKGRIIMMIVSIIIMGALFLIINLFDIESINGVTSAVDNYFYIIFPIISCILLVISYFISKKIYLNKEF